MLTLSVIESKFRELNPFGTITRKSATKYEVCYNAMDHRNEIEKEADYSWGTGFDKRKFYTYRAPNLLELAYKLNLDVSEYDEYKLSKVNQEWEEELKKEYDAEALELELFGE